MILMGNVPNNLLFLALMFFAAFGVVIAMTININMMNYLIPAMSSIITGQKVTSTFFDSGVSFWSDMQVLIKDSINFIFAFFVFLALTSSFVQKLTFWGYIYEFITGFLVAMFLTTFISYFYDFFVTSTNPLGLNWEYAPMWFLQNSKTIIIACFMAGLFSFVYRSYQFRVGGDFA